MARFGVRYSPRAVDDLRFVYEWGVENWGEREASEWLDYFDALILKRLSNIPFSCALAPEDPEFEFDLRQLTIRRYRILFTVIEDKVYVLRIRGPFAGGALEID